VARGPRPRCRPSPVKDHCNALPRPPCRILGAGDDVDLYSFRRSFLTAAESALNGGGRLNGEIIKLLAGHSRNGLALDVYSDWTRLGRRGTLDGGMAAKLKTLRAAVDDAVDLGLPSEVLKALEETAGSRPVVVRTAPAFRRISRATPS
jgi:hypothetical protein